MADETARLSLQEFYTELKMAEDKEKTKRNNESRTADEADVSALAEKSTDTVNKEFNDVNSQNNLTINDVIESENFCTSVAEKLYEIPTAVLSLCEQALCKRQHILQWLQNLVYNSGSTINSEEFSSKLDELTSESDELTASYNVAMTRLRRGVANVMDLLQQIYLERDLLKERNGTLSAQMAEVSAVNDMLQHRFLASSGDQPAKESRVKELEVELTNERSRKAILRERLQKADARAKARNEELKEALAKLDDSNMQRAALDEKIKEIERQRSATEKEHLEQTEKSKASFDANLEKLDKINDHMYELEEIIVNQRQQLEEVSSTTNRLHLLEENNKQLQKTCEQCQSQIDTMDNYTRDLQTTNQQLCQNLKNETASKNELVKELEELKSAQNLNKKQKVFVERDVQADVDIEDKHKRPSCESSLSATNNRLSSYEEQVELLRKVIAKLETNKDVRRSDSIPELKDVVVRQRRRLAGLKQELDEIRSAVMGKDVLMKKYEQSIEEQASLLRMKDEVIQMLTCKDAELMNTIEFLQQNIEAKERVEDEVRKKLMEKSDEIRKLLSKLELKKVHTLYLEKLVTDLQKREPTQEVRLDIDEFITDLSEAHARRLDGGRSTGEKQSRLNVEKLMKLLEYELGESEHIEFQRFEDQARHLMKELPLLERKKSTSPARRDIFSRSRSKCPGQAVSGLSKVKDMLHRGDDKSGCTVNFK